MMVQVFARYFKSYWEPYISSKSPKFRSKSGMGLGTFIGKTLLERKKALIDFQNIPGGGAEVKIIWKTSDIKV